MSLINQMLKDLEERRAPDGKAAGQDRGRGVQVLREREGRGKNRILFAITALLAAAGGIFAWYLANHQSSAARVESSGEITVLARGSIPVPVSQAVSLPVPAETVAVPEEVVSAQVSPPEEEISPPEVPIPAPPVRGKTSSAVTASAQKGKSPEEANPPVPEASGGTTLSADSAETGGMNKVARVLSPSQQAELAMERGAAARRTGKFTLAEKEFRHGLAADLGHLAIREALIDLLLSQGRISEASGLLREGLAAAPNHPPFKKSYGRLLVDRGADEEALTVLLQGTLPPLSEDPAYHALLAAVFQRLGQYSAAADAYGALTLHQPSAGAWWMGLGIAQESGGRNLEALTAYGRADSCRDLNAVARQYVQGRLARLKESTGAQAPVIGRD